MKSKTGNKWPNSIQTRGWKIIWKRRKKRTSLAQSVESLIKKKSYFFAMGATHHIIHIASVSTESHVDIGFAWNARTREHMQELQNLCRNRLDADSQCLDGTAPEHLQVSVVPVNDFERIIGMVLGASSVAEYMTSQVWTSISLMTIYRWPLTDVFNVAPRMRDGSSNSGSSA